MPEWKQLEQDLSHWLCSLANEQVKFRNPNQAITGFPFDGFRSDGMLTDGHVLIAIEVEAGQVHPDTNVGKYWLLQHEYCSYKRIILYHIYTPDFNSYGWRMRLGQFYAAKMQQEMPLEYCLMDYRSASEEDYPTVLAALKIIITGTLQREFDLLTGALEGEYSSR